MNILFLCTSNVNRSKTAERLLSELNPENSYRSAGLSEKYCRQYGTILCTKEMLAGADRVFVFEDQHIRRIEEHVGDLFSGKITNLDIDDVYEGEDERLCQLLTEKLSGQFSNPEDGDECE